MAAVAKPRIPVIDTSAMQPRVAARIDSALDDVRGEPGSAEAWGRLGNVCHVHEENEFAATSYREAHRLAPDDFRWTYFLARVLELNGDSAAKIIIALKEAIQRRPSYAPAHTRLGEALVRDGQLEEARSTFETAIRLDPRQGKAQRELGQVLLLLGETSLALPPLERASAIQPNDAAVWAALAQTHAKLGDTEAAKAAAAKAASRSPQQGFSDPAMQEVTDEGISSVICTRRAAEYLARGDFQNALAQYLIVAEVNSNDPRLHRQIAAVAGRARQPKLAIQHIDLAIAMDPDSIEPRIQKASLLLKDGLAEEAVVHLRQAISDLPGEPDLHAMMATALAELGQLGDSISEFEFAATLGDLKARAYRRWGNAWLANGDLSKAVLQFEKAIVIDPEYVNAHYDLAKAFEQLELIDKAIHHYRRAVQLKPGHPAAKRLQWLLSK